MTAVASGTEPAFPPGGGGLVRFRLDLAYDGTEFRGWARQPGLRTVQGVVESALATVLRLPEPPGVVCAGRTDAGVHADAQVAHADLPASSAPGARDSSPGEPESLTLLAARLRGVLPPDVRLRDVAVAAPGFDARFAALSRTYRYRIADGPGGCWPLRRGFVIPHRARLDLEVMNIAAEKLLGEHDFGAFCRRREGATTIRRLLALRWERNSSDEAELCVTADAFCHSMVRALVGVLVPVADGRRPVTWPAAVLARRVRDPAVTVMPARALVLSSVAYPQDHELTARARQTRQLRGGPLP